ncbi:hypothetical protein DPSP01_009811 [Paraphaeosphaeria sporulosa]
MIELLSLQFETSRDVSRKRFEEFDGTLPTWTPLKSLFRDIQSVLVGKVYCVIDGMQWLGDFTELTTMLRHGNLNVLFITSKLSRYLLGNLERDELVMVGGRSADSSLLWQLEEGMRELE